MRTRVVVLGAGFGGLEVTTILSEALGEEIDVTLIDRNASFVFGFAKIDLLFGRRTAADVRHAYADILKPGVRFVQTAVRSIDPAARRVATDAGTFSGDVLVVALGADVHPEETPGLLEGGNEFYSVAGAEKLATLLPAFVVGHAIVGAASKLFKCPPAPSETALLLHDYLVERGRRDACEISVVLPFPTPIPPSPDSSRAVLDAFAERGIRFVADNVVRALDPLRKVAFLSDGSELEYALFLGVPMHRAPAVVVDAGLTEDGWVPVNPRTLETRFPGVYAIGDVTSVGTPKAGVFAEGAARVVAAAIVGQLRGGAAPDPFTGQGSCYVEFGGGQVGRVDVDFLGGPKPSSTFKVPSGALSVEKREFRLTRLQRWFGSST